MWLRIRWTPALITKYFKARPNALCSLYQKGNCSGLTSTKAFYESVQSSSLAGNWTLTNLYIYMYVFTAVLKTDSVKVITTKYVAFAKINSSWVTCGPIERFSSYCFSPFSSDIRKCNQLLKNSSSDDVTVAKIFLATFRADACRLTLFNLIFFCSLLIHVYPEGRFPIMCQLFEPLLLPSPSHETMMSVSATMN